MKVTQKNVLENFKNVSKKDALLIVQLCNGTKEPDTLPAGSKRVDECYNRPHHIDLVLTCINVILEGYGVEGTEFERNAMRQTDFISYVNMGDTYRVTILYNPDTSRFEINDWGSVYEISPAWAAQNETEEETA